MKSPIQGTSILLHGPKKVGKTSLAADFPKPVLFIATEPGHRYISKQKGVHIFKVYTEKDWPNFRAFVRDKLEILKPKTIVVDTTNTFYQICSTYVCRREGKEYPTEIGARGLGWDKVRRELLESLNELAMVSEKLNATQIFICHTRVEEIEYRTITLKRQTYILQLQPDDVVAANVDNIWHLGFAVDDEGEEEISNYRTLWLKGNAHVMAESRDPTLQVGRIRRLRPETAYNQIVKAFTYRRKK